MPRDLDWEGGFNIRDLGDLVSEDGRITRSGAIVRSGNLHKLTARGWQQLYDYGIRSLVDLRNADEQKAEPYTAPNAAITCLHYPLEEERKPEHTEFWKQWRSLNCTPLYYCAFADQHSERLPEVVSMFANALPGGVLFHCGIGRDRTGLIAIFLLKLLGVPNDAIFSDFSLSSERLRPHWAVIGRKNDEADIAKLLQANQSSARTVVFRTAETLDQKHVPLVSQATLTALRSRFLD